MKSFFFTCISIILSFWSHAQSLNELNQRTLELYEAKKYREALPLAIKASDLAYEKYGEKDNVYHATLTMLSLLYNNLDDYQKAEPVYTKLCILKKTAFGENSNEYSTAVSNLAFLYFDMNDFKKAEPCFVLVKKINGKVFGETHAEYINSVTDLAVLYTNMGKFSEAEANYLDAIKLRKTVQGDSSMEYSNSLNGLAMLYSRLGRFGEAEQLYLKAKDIRKKIEGEASRSYGSILNNLASLYSRTGEYEKAEALNLQALEIIRKNEGDNSLSFATTLNNLAIVYSRSGQYLKAEKTYLPAAELRKRILGEQHPLYAGSLNDLGVLYVNMGNYQKSEPLLLEALQKRKQLLGEQHPDYRGTLHNLSSHYLKAGNLKEAERYSFENLAIAAKGKDGNLPDYATSLNNHAMILADLGKYEEAEKYYVESTEVRKKLFGEAHPEYLTSIANLASLYSQAGRKDTAEQLLLRARSKKQGEDRNDKQYALILDHLATLYTNAGQYEKAEPLFLESINILKSLGIRDRQTSAVYNNTALLYAHLGQYQKAEQFYLEAIENDKRSLGTEHYEYATNLNNLASLYAQTQRYDKAEKLLAEALAIIGRSLGNHHPAYANSMNNLGSLYFDLKNYVAVEPLLLNAKEIRKVSLGINHSSYGESCNNLGRFYLQMGRLKEAGDNLLEGAEVYRKTIGVLHPDFASNSLNLGNFYTSMGENQKAESFFLAAGRAEVTTLLNSFAVLSEQEKANYLRNTMKVLEMNQSFLIQNPKASSNFYEQNFLMELAVKGIALFDTRKRLEVIREAKDTLAQQLFLNWIKLKNLLSVQYSLPEERRKKDLLSLEGEAENIEKNLMRHTAGFEPPSLSSISIKDIQSRLNDGEAAVEFIRFRFYNGRWTDSVYYAAYVLTNKLSTPAFVRLFEEKQMQKIFSFRPLTNESIKAMYRSEIIDDGTERVEPGDSIFHLLWKPLMPYLTGVHKIIYSPVGLLHKVAFNALPMEDSSLLIDKYELQQYTSLRQLVTFQDDTVRPKGIAVFGDCDFSTIPVSKGKTAPGKTSVSAIANSPSSSRAAWKQLPGTLEEMHIIKTLFEKNQVTTAVYSRKAASEESLKAQSGKSPSILHLATHGFFFADPHLNPAQRLLRNNKNSIQNSDNPLMRSGIVLSGANHAWSGQSVYEGEEDGIVTALEISQLDLSGTGLVVLSACETALGDIKGNEGVFGLQRAFKLAGVKNMILSLWKVPDAETAELMTAFYTFYLNGESIRNAFSSAQKQMRAKYRPFYWAAFVLIE